MIQLENTTVTGWKDAIRGMRNPMNSWDKSDSGYRCSQNPAKRCVAHCVADTNCRPDNFFVIGQNDHDLMMKLAKAGPTHAKYRRMLTVYVDITAPFYWWKEFDTYKVGTVANSCSTMHKLTHKPFELDDFSHDRMNTDAVKVLEQVIAFLNLQRNIYLDGIHGQLKGDKEFWWNMIQLLPTSYNQKRTVMMNYEVLAGIYPNRKDHRLTEWHVFCDWIKSLPYSELITLEESKDSLRAEMEKT